MAKRKAITIGIGTRCDIHPDGSACREGLQIVYKGFTPCCDMFETCTKNCEYDIRFEWRGTFWGVRIPDGGNSVYEIKFCPFCGVKLK